MSTPPIISRKHMWSFFRRGGLDQVALTTGADLLNLQNLDLKLWVALSCPVKGLELDDQTLALIDADKDGYIHPREIFAAINWAAPFFKDAGDLLKGTDEIPFASLNDKSPQGKTARETATKVLQTLGKNDAHSISLSDTSDIAKIYASSKFNGDGIIPSDASEDPHTQQVITDIVTTVGSAQDPAKPSQVDAAKVDAFFSACAEFSHWSAKGTASDILTLGEITPRAADAVRAVRSKVDDYFMRCRLAAFDARAATALNRQESDYAALATKDLAADVNDVASFPIAHVEAQGLLPLLTRVNPSWVARLAALHKDAVTPILGPNKITLTELEWDQIKAKVQPYEDWLKNKSGNPVAPLGLDRIQSILSSNYRETLTSLIEQDRAFKAEAAAVGDLVRLLRYQRDLRTLLHNFVNFADFYSPDRLAVFQAGVLYFDSRSLDLCIRVDDPAAHAVLASLSKLHIAYVECKRQPGNEVMKIAACFTQGDSDYLIVGRNGLFYDRHGKDWNATITKIIENPISVAQAFMLPYKRFIRFIEEQVAKRAAASDAASAAALEATAAAHANGEMAKPPAPKRIDVGTVAALGVGVGSITTAIGMISTKLVDIQPWKLPLIFIGLIAIISGPSMLIAWLKLRQRTLGPVLDANGWAINGRVKINIPFGTALTQKKVLPPGSKRSLHDPYEDKAAARRHRNTFIFILILATVLSLVVLKAKGKWPFIPEPEGVIAPTA